LVSEFVQPEVLKSHIRDIRAALGDDPKNPHFIETLPRRGYQFIAAVSDGSVTSNQAISAAKCRIHPLDVDTRLHSLRDLVEVDGGGNNRSAMTIDTVGHGSAAARVRKLVETFRMAGAAV